MRRTWISVAGLTCVAGCFAPFSWPDDRVPTPGPDVAVATPTATEAASANATAGPPASSSAALPAPDALALAAACLDRGDDAGALPHLRAHVAAYPDAVMMRAYLAELLLKLGLASEARSEFERVTAEATASGPMSRQVVHCHTRLMEIAQEADDSFAEELHRGIGLVLLVRRWSAEPDGADSRLSEQTLAKAVTALRSARDLDPADPRPSAYLAEAYDGLGQPSAARAQRRTARAGGPWVGVSPADDARMWQP